MKKKITYNYNHKTFLKFIKAKINLKIAQDYIKENTDEIYSIMIEHGTQKINKNGNSLKSTYVLTDSQGFTLELTERNGSEIVNYKCLAMSLLNMNDKQIDEYAKAHGFTTQRKGSTVYNASVQAIEQEQE